MKFRLRLFLVAMLLSVGVCAAVAQDSKREAQLRTVRGVVVDKSSEVGVASAVVFLKTCAPMRCVVTSPMRKAITVQRPRPQCRLRNPRRKRWRKSATRTVSQFRQQERPCVSL